MSRSTPHREPHDWVTRAADDAIRHHEKSGATGPVTCSSGASPSGRVHLGNLREFLMPHFVADELRRRGVPVRHLHVWDDYDRFRKVPAGVDPSWADHIGRPLTAVPDPWDCHASWSDHFKEPLVAALHELGVDMEEISQTERYRAGVYREEVLRAVRHRAEIDAVLAQHRTKRPAVSEATGDAAGEHAAQEAEAMAESVAHDDEGRPRGRERGGLLPVQGLLPRLRARHHDRDVVRRRHHRPDLHLLGLRLPRHHQPRHAGRGQAGLEGRLADALGLRARRLRARGHGPRDTRVVVHGGARAGRDGVGLPEAGVVRLRLRRVRRGPEDVVVRRRRSDRRGGPAGARARDPALALRAPAAEADLRHRLRARGRPAVRRVGRARAQGGRPGEARRPGARLRAGVGDPDRGAAARAGGRRTVPDAGVRGRRDRRVGRPDQPDRLPPRPRPRLGRPARAAAVAGDGVDGGVRAGRRPDDGATEPDAAAIEALTSREREWVSLLLQGLPGRPRAGAGDRPRLRRTQARARAARSTTRRPTR